MQDIIYAVVALLATLTGAITGMGGGVIMKPVFDAFKQYDAATIGVITSVTVFAMSFVSVVRHVHMRTKIEPRVGFALCAGSVFGGYAGQFLIGQLERWLNSNGLLTIVQNAFLFLLIVCVMLYMLRKDRIHALRNTETGPVLLCGFLLGTLSSFLGIGGGPFNVAAILFVFGCDTRTAAVYSILTILFAQLSKLATIAFTTGYAQYDLRVLPLVMLCGVAGGFLGAKLNKNLNDRAIDRCFNVIQVIILSIVLGNIIRYSLSPAA